MTVHNNSAFPRPIVAPPALADVKARRNLAERFQCFGLTEAAARSVADASADPSAVRQFIGEPEKPNFETRRTPIGVVKGIPLSVFATRVMPDPRNPRVAPIKQHQFATDPAVGEAGHRYPPIADPRSAAAGVPELILTVQNREHPAYECSNAAAYIARHNDWEQSIRDQGVMEPIWLAATTYVHADGSPGGVAATTVDGSSRLTAVHKVIRDAAAFLNFRSADVPYRGDDDVKFRADLRRMADWIDNNEVDDARAAVLRNLVVPVFVIVGYESGRTGVKFHAAVKSLVALRHVDPPTPWGSGPEHEALADEVVDQLEANGILTGPEAAYFRGSLTRAEAETYGLSPDASVRSARVMDVLFSHDDATRAAIRSAITVQSTRKLITSQLMRELASVLMLRGVKAGSPREADQKRKYLVKAIPALAERRDAAGGWTATGRGHDALVAAALAEVDAAKAAGRSEPGPATAELAVRSALALVAGEALAGVRGFDRTGGSDERQPAAVIDAMRHTRRGVRQLGAVLTQFARGETAFDAVDEHGRVKTADGAATPIKLSDSYLRDEFPPADKVNDPGPGDQPQDVYAREIKAFESAVDALSAARAAVTACREHGVATAGKYGVNFRACQRMLDILHTVGEDVAVWKQVDINYTGHDPDAETDDASA